MDNVRTKNQELERELKPHQANTQKHLENPVARHYGAMVVQPEMIEAVRHSSNLVANLGVYHLR